MADLGNLLFTFAVVADTHMNQEEAQSSSPYACNRLANARTRHVLQQINRLAPAFVVHLGDLVNPVPALPSYAPAAANFHALAEELDCPLHLTPGNHDIGDKPVAWSPAAAVSDDYVALYEEHFGAHYYSFDHGDCHFVVINAQLFNSGLAAASEQSAWLESDLADSRGRRTFLCTHYPPYVTDPGEDGSYDNIDEPARSWLLGLIERHRPEALFAGHVHNFWYDVYGATECYILPSTAFVRHDYAELYRIEPGPENGRDDAPKLGYLVVKVYAKGHVAHVVRTYGATVDEGAVLAPDKERLVPLHTRENPAATVGVDLRHPWAEVMEIAASGAVDEFQRKRARNDYSLMALWEMGVRKLRVPLHDLADPGTRRRMEILEGLGHEFTVFSFDIPEGRLRRALVDNRHLVDAWEVVLPWQEAAERIERLRHLKDRTDVPVLLSKLRTHEDARYDGARFHHFINHGFTLAEAETVAAFLDVDGVRALADGFVFRVPRDLAPWQALPAAGAIAREQGIRVALHMRTASGNPAEDFTDDLANANRIAEAVFAAHAEDGVDVFLDTFLDADRGYFTRTGLVDRRCNPRMAAHVVRNLHAAFATLPAGLSPGDSLTTDEARICPMSAAGTTVHLILPAAPGVCPGAGAGTGARWIDLVSGDIERSRPAACRGPVLLCTNCPG